MLGVMVDGYSSGRFLAKELLDAGVDLIHVQSSENIPEQWRSNFDVSIYTKNFIYCNNLTKLLEKLGSLHVGFVIAGSESGVIIAEQLASFFKVPGNNPSTSKLRRNKVKMMEAIRKANIASVDEISLKIADSYPQIDDTWFPVVVKPSESCGGDDVRICENYVMMIDAINHIFSKKNIIGVANTELVIQKKLLGTQFMINTISYNGNHKIIEIWKEERTHTKDGYSIYDKEILMPSDFDHSTEIQSYIKSVLTALNITYGPAHTEIFFTENGPILLESAARIQGGVDGKASEAALGYSHISCTKNLLLDSNWFDTLNDQYRPKTNLMLVNLISYADGVINKSNIDNTIKLLPSFSSSSKLPVAGSTISKTINLLTKPGHVYLVNANLEQLYKDYEAIRKLESENLIFEIGI